MIFASRRTQCNGDAGRPGCFPGLRVVGTIDRVFAPTMTIVQHDSAASAGHLPDWLDDVEPLTVHAWQGEPVPTIECVGDGLVVLGGAMGVYDNDEAPWLTATGELLAAAVERGVPTLAIGLGFQLLVRATGGRVTVAAPPGPEAGMIRVKARPASAADPVLSAMFDGRGEIYQPALHRDAVVELPAGATWLAQSPMYPFQAARIGSALGVQFHPEIDHGQLERWAARDGLDLDVISAQVAAHAEESRGGGARLVRAFAASLRVSADVSADQLPVSVDVSV